MGEYERIMWPKYIVCKLEKDIKTPILKICGWGIMAHDRILTTRRWRWGGSRPAPEES
jgi:hypothetical protein